MAQTKCTEYFVKFGYVVFEICERRHRHTELRTITPQIPAGKPPQYFTKLPRPSQPPILSEAGNEYQTECGDALRMGLKAGR